MTAVHRRSHERGATPLGDRIKQMRLQREFGLYEFARLVGTDSSVIARIENKGAKPQWETAVAIAQVLECSLDWLAGMTTEEIAA
jgi:transcriptional regulator with XRE-family HTH domain